jgi:hypothetical protein
VSLIAYSAPRLHAVPNGTQQLELPGADKLEQLAVATWIAKSMLVQESLIRTFTESGAGTTKVYLAIGLL